MLTSLSMTQALLMTSSGSISPPIWSDSGPRKIRLICAMPEGRTPPQRASVCVCVYVWKVCVCRGEGSKVKIATKPRPQTEEIGPAMPTKWGTVTVHLTLLGVEAVRGH